MDISLDLPTELISGFQASDKPIIFHKVNDVLPEEQEMIKIEHDISVRQALQIMKKRNISQIPVMCGNLVLGIFSFRSFSTKVLEFKSTELDFDRLQVRDFCERGEYVDVFDDFSKTFKVFEKDDVVLVGRKTELIGLLSPIDLVRFVYHISRPFILIGEIEAGIKEIIRILISHETFLIIVQDALADCYKDRSLPKKISDLTFSDYAQIIGYGRSWNHFAPIFGDGELQRKMTISKLKTLAELRNDVFHFRRKIKNDDIDVLISHRDWIEDRLTIYEGKV